VRGIRDTKNNYVRVYLASIRRKLEPDPAHPRYFLTEPRSGVRFDSGEPPVQRDTPESLPSLEIVRESPRRLEPQPA
jgi:DNA-binding winged helix-turn-helix (wHTH) protein